MTKAAQAYTRHLQPGQRFNKLTAVAPAGHESHGRKKPLWLFRCDCGSEFVVRLESVKGGNTKSCGCHKRDTALAMGLANVTHGQSDTRIYSIWGAMHRRCENPKNSRFEYYGGRGIRVCDEWQSL